MRVTALACRLLLACSLFLSTRNPLAAADWRPITPEEFAAKRSPLDPSAGAVVLLREITIDNGDFDGAMQAYYVRIKVFDPQAIDALLQTEIPYAKNQRARNIAARVVRPDGTSVDVEPSAIFTREVVRIGREALRVKSFAFPALEPGCIIEYQYRIYSDDILLGMHLPMSDAYPIVTARIRMKNFSLPGLGIQSLWSEQLHMSLLDKTDHGFRVFEGHDVVPVPAEPLSPPDSVTKPWFTFYFTEANGTAVDFWSYEAGALATAAREQLAPKRPVQALAAKLTTGLTDDAAKLGRLYDFCRTEIKNISSDASGYTPDQIEALKPNRSPTDTLKNRYGTELDINVLFGALLNSLGAKCCLAYCGDRSLYVFHRDLKLRGALPHVVVGIPRGLDYEFYDPGAMYLPAGELRWMNQETTALVIEGKRWRFVNIPPTGPEHSTIRRSARLRLDDQGTVEGDVTIEMTGHDGIAAKHDYDAKTDDQRRDEIQKALVERLGRAEVSDFTMTHVTDPDQPIQIHYHVKAEDYAELTADRIFLQPAFFQKGVPPVFTAAERKNAIFFPYQFTTSDDVAIDLPAGFELEEPRAPAPVNVNGLLLCQPRLEYAPRAHRLLFKREYTFNGDRVPAAFYPQLKQSFDRVLNHDAHKVALHRAGPPAAGVEPAPAVSSPTESMTPAPNGSTPAEPTAASPPS